ncbi:MAG: metal ABC transporter substrate-binding protein [Halothiobacillaceae bacterium]
MKRLNLLSITLLLTILVGVQPAWAKDLNVVATTPSMGVLASAVGKDLVSVHTLIGPDRDAHALTARPSMIARLRQADLLVAVGAGLEDGWLPAAVDGSANPALRPGQPGYLEVAKTLDLRDTRFDPAQGGHLHLEGNPHFNLSPDQMRSASQSLADHLARLDPEHADRYRDNARTFVAELDRRLEALRTREIPPIRVIAYHEEFDYFRDWLPVEVVAFLEPKPGVPPTAGHIASLYTQWQGQAGAIVLANYQPDRKAISLGERLGWPVRALPLEPAGDQPEDYFTLMERWTSAVRDLGQDG